MRFSTLIAISLLTGRVALHRSATLKGKPDHMFDPTDTAAKNLTEQFSESFLRESTKGGEHENIQTEATRTESSGAESSEEVEAATVSSKKGVEDARVTQTSAARDKLEQERDDENDIGRETVEESEEETVEGKEGRNDESEDESDDSDYVPSENEDEESEDELETDSEEDESEQDTESEPSETIADQGSENETISPSTSRSQIEEESEDVSDHEAKASEEDEDTDESSNEEEELTGPSDEEQEKDNAESSENETPAEMEESSKTKSSAEPVVEKKGFFQEEQIALSESDFQDILPDEKVLALGKGAKETLSRKKKPGFDVPREEIGTKPEVASTKAESEDEDEAEETETGTEKYEEEGETVYEKGGSDETSSRDGAARKVRSGLGLFHMRRERTVSPQTFKKPQKEPKVHPDEAPPVISSYPSFARPECQAYLDAISKDNVRLLNEQLAANSHRYIDTDCFSQMLLLAATANHTHCLSLLFYRYLPSFERSQLQQLERLIAMPIIPAPLLDEFMVQMGFDESKRLHLIEQSFKSSTPAQFVEAVDYWHHMAHEQLSAKLFDAEQKRIWELYLALDEGRPLTFELPPISAATVSALTRSAQLSNPARSQPQAANITYLLRAVPDKYEALLHGHRNILDLWVQADPKEAQAFLKKNAQSLLSNPLLPLKSFLSILQHCPKEWINDAKLLADESITRETRFALRLHRDLVKVKSITGVCENPSAKTLDLAPLLPEATFQAMTATVQGIILSHMIHIIFGLHPDLQVCQQGLFRSNVEVFKILTEFCEQAPPIDILSR